MNIGVMFIYDHIWSYMDTHMIIELNHIPCMTDHVRNLILSEYDCHNVHILTLWCSYMNGPMFTYEQATLIIYDQKCKQSYVVLSYVNDHIWVTIYEWSYVNDHIWMIMWSPHTCTYDVKLYDINVIIGIPINIKLL